MHILVELVASALLALIVTVIHGTGVVVMTKLFSRELSVVRSHGLAYREFMLMVPQALFLLFLHTVEIVVFSLFYLAVGAVEGLEAALFFSASAYSTLGQTAALPEAWRLVGAFEGLTGFLMIGWSAAIFVTDMERVLHKRRPSKDQLD